MSLSDNTNKVILDNYYKKGKVHTLDLSMKLLQSQLLRSKGSSSIGVIGQIAESVLEVCILDYIIKNKKKDWFYSKGMILKDIASPNSGFLTEIDLVLFTPQKILLFECKSYKGNKKLSEKGTLTSKNNVKFNVFEQHRNHVLVFMKIFEAFKIGNSPIGETFRMPIFSFAEGRINDTRAEVWKKLMPLLEVNTIDDYLTSQIKGPKNWNMPYVKRAVSIIEKKKSSYRSKHIEYVSDLNRNRDKDR